MVEPVSLMRDAAMNGWKEQRVTQATQVFRLSLWSMATPTCRPGAAREDHRIDNACQQRAMGARGVLGRPVYAAPPKFAGQSSQTPAWTSSAMSTKCNDLHLLH